MSLRKGNVKWLRAFRACCMLQGVRDSELRVVQFQQVFCLRTRDAAIKNDVQRARRTLDAFRVAWRNRVRFVSKSG